MKVNDRQEKKTVSERHKSLHFPVCMRENQILLTRMWTAGFVASFGPYQQFPERPLHRHASGFLRLQDKQTEAAGSRELEDESLSSTSFRKEEILRKRPSLKFTKVITQEQSSSEELKVLCFDVQHFLKHF